MHTSLLQESSQQSNANDKDDSSNWSSACSQSSDEITFASAAA